MDARAAERRGGGVNEAVVRGLVERFYLRMWNAWGDSVVAETLAARFAFCGSLGQLTASREGWRVGVADEVVEPP
jgi:hypothetical protein